VEGVRGHHRPTTLKALVFYEGGWLGEAEISYAGPNAEARARLAMDVVRQRMGATLSMRFDLIGVLSILGDSRGEALARHAPGHAQDVRLRVAVRHDDEHEIERLLREVYSLWLCGPAGGGGVRTSKRQRLDSVSCLVPRSLVPARALCHGTWE
jgi:Acyclic terpene utilisation family protein AtuA